MTKNTAIMEVRNTYLYRMHRGYFPPRLISAIALILAILQVASSSAQYSYSRDLLIDTELEGKEIYSLQLDSDGSLWAQTNDFKLYKYDGQAFYNMSAAWNVDLPVITSIRNYKNQLWLRPSNTASPYLLTINQLQTDTCFFPHQPSIISVLDSSVTILVKDSILSYTHDLKNVLHRMSATPPDIIHDPQVQSSELTTPDGRLIFTRLYNRETKRHELWRYEKMEWKIVNSADAKFSFFAYSPDSILTAEVTRATAPFKIRPALCTNCPSQKMIEYVNSTHISEYGNHVVEKEETPRGDLIYTVYAIDNRGQSTQEASYRMQGRFRLKIRSKQEYLYDNNKSCNQSLCDILVFSDVNSDFPPYLHSITEDDQGRIWFGGYHTGYGLWEDDKPMLRVDPEHSPNAEVLPGSYRDSHGTMYALTESGGLEWGKYDHWNSQNYFYKRGTKNRLVGYYLDHLADTILLIGSNSHGLLMVDIPILDTPVIQSIDTAVGMDLVNVLAITKDNRNRIWMARPSQGIALYDPQSTTARTFLETDGEKKLRIFSMHTDSRGSLWLGGEKGLYILQNASAFDPSTESFFSALDQFPIYHPYGRISYMAEYNDYLVFGDAYGAHFLSLDSFYQVANYTSLSSIPTAKVAALGPAEQNSVLVDSKNRLWMGHDHGAMMISSLDFIADPYEKPTYTLQKWNDISARFDTVQKSIETDRLQRDVRCRFVRSHHGNIAAPLIYQYALLINNQEDTSTHTLTDNVLSIQDVSPGRHILLTRAVYKNSPSVWQSTRIHVPHTLNESKWFWAILVLGLCTLSGIIFYLNRRRVLQEKQLQLERAELHSQRDRLRIQAIANSLNPHFINNSLYWIQAKMLQDKEAVQVVQRLSENIQSIFKKSRAGVAHHTLDEEMRMIENYLIVQSARFGEKITYDIHPEELFEKFKNFNLPLLQLQIHIENAVEHGLRNSDLEPRISLRITEENDTLHFLIEDNGIGRAAAKKLGSQGTQQGLKMLESLHGIYRSHNDQEIRCYYDDEVFTADDDTRYGTRVHIHIPYTYRYEI